MIERVGRFTGGIFVTMLLACMPAAAEKTQQPVDHGQNTAAGATVDVGGVRLYYEIHGKGKPLVVLHANGGNIGTMGRQIAHFSPSRQVIAIDSRGHGRSEPGDKPLTYEMMAEDVVAVMDHLKIPSADVLGWSDGGILGLIVASQHPERVKKLAIMGANLNPEGAYDWAQKWVTREDQKADRAIQQHDTSRDWAFYKQQLNLMGKQPHIPLTSLKKITAPTLVMAGDKDIIRPEHSQLIFANIPNAQLCIFPGSSHMAPITDAELFNLTVETFLKREFRRPESRDFLQ